VQSSAGCVAAAAAWATGRFRAVYGRGRVAAGITVCLLHTRTVPVWRRLSQHTLDAAFTAIYADTRSAASSGVPALTVVWTVRVTAVRLYGQAGGCDGGQCGGGIVVSTAAAASVDGGRSYRGRSAAHGCRTARGGTSRHVHAWSALPCMGVSCRATTSTAAAAAADRSHIIQLLALLVQIVQQLLYPLLPLYALLRAVVVADVLRVVA
jgi:hypothetical protein